MLSGLLRERQRLVNSRQGLFYVLPFGVDLGDQSLIEWDPIPNSLRGNCRNCLSKLRNDDFIFAATAPTCARPTEKHHPWCQKLPEFHIRNALRSCLLPRVTRPRYPPGALREKL